MNFDQPEKEPLESFEGDNQKTEEEMKADEALSQEIDKAGGFSEWCREQAENIVNQSGITSESEKKSETERIKAHLESMFKNDHMGAKMSAERQLMQAKENARG